MPTLEIQGQRVEVGDDFTKLSAADQQATVNDIAAKMGTAKPQSAAQSPGAQSGANAAAHGFINDLPIVGPTLNDWADKAEAGIRSTAYGSDYGKELAGVQSREQADVAAHPNLDTAGGVAGNITAAIPTIAVGGPMVAGLSKAAQLGIGMTAGAGIMGTDAAVRTPGSWTDKAAAALPAAGIGAVTAAVAPVAARAVGAGVRNVVDAFARRSALAGTGVEPAAAKEILRAAQADAALGGQGAQRIAAAGQNGMLADAGPATQGLLDTALQRGGTPGAQDAAARIAQRGAAADTEVSGALDTALGKPAGVQSAQSAVAADSKAARKMAYDAAYSRPIDYASSEGRSIESMVKSRVPQSAIDRANQLMRLNGEQSRQILAKVADDGAVTFERLPDVRQLDYITRGLRDVARGSEGTGALGGKTDLGAAYDNLATAIRSKLKTAVPEYGIALDTASDAISQREAVQFGADLLKQSTHRDVAQTTIANMSDAEIKQAKQGLRSQIDEVIANVKSTIGRPDENAIQQAMAGVKMLSSDAARQKISMLVPKNEANALFRKIDQAAKSLELRASVATNSRTYGRQAAAKAVEEAAAPGPVGRLLAGEPVLAGKSAAQTVLGTGPAEQIARQDKTWSSLADILTRPNAVPLLQQFEKANAISGRGQGLASLLGGAAGAGTAVLGNQTRLQLQGR
jgi:hypothetical protein